MTETIVGSWEVFLGFCMWLTQDQSWHPYSSLSLPRRIPEHSQVKSLSTIRCSPQKKKNIH